MCAALNSTLNVKLELGGGAELLFGNVRKHRVQLPINEERKSWNLEQFLQYVKDNLLQERPELLIRDNSVRPGILVLINDADWELLGQLDYQLEEGDTITFISTLHGG